MHLKYYVQQHLRQATRRQVVLAIVLSAVTILLCQSPRSVAFGRSGRGSLPGGSSFAPGTVNALASSLYQTVGEAGDLGSFYQTYPTAEELSARVARFPPRGCAQYGSSRVVARSWGGRAVHLLRIGPRGDDGDVGGGERDGGEDSEKARIRRRKKKKGVRTALVTAGMHANERAVPLAALATAEHFCMLAAGAGGVEGDEVAAALRDRLELLVVALLNPDGLEATTVVEREVNLTSTSGGGGVVAAGDNNVTDGGMRENSGGAVSVDELSIADSSSGMDGNNSTVVHGVATRRLSAAAAGAAAAGEAAGTPRTGTVTEKRRERVRRPSRKNGRREKGVAGCAAPRENGVDLNRNFPDGFGVGNGSSSSPCAIEYSGPGALSEPESAGVASVVGRHAPDGLLDVHAFGQLLLVGKAGSAGRNQSVAALERQVQLAFFVQQAVQAVNGSQLAIVEAREASLATTGREAGGTLLDYAGSVGVPAVVYEMPPAMSRANRATGFRPEEDQLAVRITEVIAAVGALLTFVSS